MKPVDWLKWGVATAIAAVTMTVSAMTWAYGNFTPKDVFNMVVERLDRIEQKLDRVLE